MALARRGARPVELDLSERQLGHARRLQDETGVRFPLVQGDAERVPLRDGRFDTVFADHGAFSFADPYRTVPEAARLLRPRRAAGLQPQQPDLPDRRAGRRRLRRRPAGLRLLRPAPDRGSRRHGRVRPAYGAWIRLFRDCGLVVEDLIEPRPGPLTVSTYRDADDLAWSRRWPSECIWRTRKG
jgi:hypothetical protein